MHSKYLGTVFGLFFIAALASCKNYSVSVNNNMVYTPPPLFKNFTIADSHLRDCVQQTIIDNHITKAEDLKQLNCSNAGIASLAGLETFHAITHLNLAENNLTAVAQLSTFDQLRVLILRKNNLTSTEPLLHLLQLRELDIASNDKLNCGDLAQLLANFHKGELTAVLPEQCKTSK